MHINRGGGGGANRALGRSRCRTVVGSTDPGGGVSPCAPAGGGTKSAFGSEVGIQRETHCPSDRNNCSKRKYLKEALRDKEGIFKRKPSETEEKY